MRVNQKVSMKRSFLFQLTLLLNVHTTQAWNLILLLLLLLLLVIYLI
jgi:hypothetical protein